MDFLLDSPGGSPVALQQSPQIKRKETRNTDMSLERADEEQSKQAHTLSSNMSEPEEMPEPLGDS